MGARTSWKDQEFVGTGTVYAFYEGRLLDLPANLLGAVARADQVGPWRKVTEGSESASEVSDLEGPYTGTRHGGKFCAVRISACGIRPRSFAAFSRYFNDLVTQVAREKVAGVDVFEADLEYASSIGYFFGEEDLIGSTGKPQELPGRPHSLLASCRVFGPDGVPIVRKRLLRELLDTHPGEVRFEVAPNRRSTSPAGMTPATAVFTGLTFPGGLWTFAHSLIVSRTSEKTKVLVR